MRCGWLSGIAAPARSTVPLGAAGIALVTPSVVLTMITVQRALWLIRFGTFPSRNSLRPAIPALPTTSTSIAASPAAPTIAIAGSSSTTTWARPRRPASRSASDWRASAAAAARVRSAEPNSVSDGLLGTITCTRCSSAPNRSAKSFAQPTARDAVWERSVPTITRWIGPARSGCALTGASWQRGRLPGREASVRRGRGGATSGTRCGSGSIRRERGEVPRTRDGGDDADRDGTRREVQTEPIGHLRAEDQAPEPGPGGAFHQRHAAVSRGDAPTGAGQAGGPEPHDRREEGPCDGQRRRGGCGRRRDLGRRTGGERSNGGILACAPQGHRVGIAVEGRRVAQHDVSHAVAGHRGAQEVERADHCDRRRIAIGRKIDDDGPRRCCDAGTTAAAVLAAGSAYGLGARTHSQTALTAIAETATIVIGVASRWNRSRTAPRPMAASSGRQKANATIRCGGNHRPTSPAATPTTVTTDHANSRRPSRPWSRRSAAAARGSHAHIAYPATFGAKRSRNNPWSQSSWCVWSRNTSSDVGTSKATPPDAVSRPTPVMATPARPTVAVDTASRRRTSPAIAVAIARIATANQRNSGWAIPAAPSRTAASADPQRRSSIRNASARTNSAAKTAFERWPAAR